MRAEGFREMSTVLVVEDEEQVRVLAESLLQEYEHQTRSASSVDEAIALLESDASIEVLFTDLGLRDDLQAGISLARMALELRPNLPVIYTTGQAVTDGMRALFVENSQMLPKPYTVDQLVSAVEAAKSA